MKGKYKKLIEENTETSRLLYDFYKNLTFLFSFDKEQEDSISLEKRIRRPVERKRSGFLSSLFFVPLFFLGDTNIRPINFRESKSSYATESESKEGIAIPSEEIENVEGDIGRPSETISVVPSESLEEEPISSGEIRKLEKEVQSFETSTEIKPVTSFREAETTSLESISSIEKDIVSPNESDAKQDEVVQETLNQVDSQFAKKVPSISQVESITNEVAKETNTSTISPKDISEVESNNSSELKNRFIEEIKKNETNLKKDYNISKEVNQTSPKITKDARKSIEAVKSEIESMDKNKTSVAKEVQSSTAKALKPKNYAKPTTSKEIKSTKPSIAKPVQSSTVRPTESKVKKVQDSYETVSKIQSTKTKPTESRVKKAQDSYETKTQIESSTMESQKGRTLSSNQPKEAQDSKQTKERIEPTQKVYSIPETKQEEYKANQTKQIQELQSNNLPKQTPVKTKTSKGPPKATTPVSKFSLTDLDQYRKFKYLADVEMYYEKTRRDRETLISIERELNEIRERNVLNEEIEKRIRSLVYHKVQASGRIKKELEKLKKSNPNPFSTSVFEVKGNDSAYSLSTNTEGGEEGLGGNESDTEIPSITVFPGVTKAIQDFLDKAID